MSSFDQFQLPPSIAKALQKLSFTTPTPIQTQAIPVGLAGRDVIGMAQTGTGKTAAFSIPMAVRLMNQPHQNGLVLAPTRELAMQIHEFLKKLAGDNFNIKPSLLIGGMSMKAQFKELRDRPRILIATPGRLCDHVRREPKLLSRTSILVLDEADRMLDMGFLPQIRAILKALPKQRQTMMFSATFPPEIKRLTNEFMYKPETVSVGAPSKPIEKIEQKTIETTQKQKNDVLMDELKARQGSVLIFTRTKHRTDRLTRFLESYGHKVARIHGNRSQAQRRMAIEGFSKGHFRILVATDIASRGLDIHNIAHVINYDLPQVPEDYIHRIGRTARNGRAGQALCLLTPEDRQMWKSISRLTTTGKATATEWPSNNKAPATRVAGEHKPPAKWQSNERKHV